MAKCTYENFPVHKACWVKPNDAKVMNLKNLDE
jgi:peptide chain release factor 3